MTDIPKSHDLHIENDKWAAPFLLAASFQNLIQFVGSYSQEGILYWQFSPKDKAVDLIQRFRTRTEPHIPSYSLFEAIDTFWKQVSSNKHRQVSSLGAG